ncbi:MAG: hypothetical protein ACXW2L_21165 [Burkholderiales bacterium]
MQTTSATWTIFESDTPVLTYTYSFGPGMANALAVGGEGGLMVVSPPYRVQQKVFDEVESYGPVRALVASNAFHYMGIPEWKRRFPAAEVFAPAQSIARVERKTGLTGIRPLAAAITLGGMRVDLTDMPFYRTGEALVRIRSSRGLAWYVTDIILNYRELPEHPLVKVLFRLSGNAPGLRYNRIAPLFMVVDRTALKRWFAREFEKDAPRWLIAAHGEIADLGADPAAAQKLFELS